MPLETETVEAVFRSLLPPEAKVVALAIADAPADWSVPPEVARARGSRVREFIAGRYCATRVVALLGLTGAIGRTPNRAPTWPMGMVGSISHSGELAVAAGGRFAGLGIDLEPALSAEALKDLRASTIDDAEWRIAGEDPAVAGAVFSAKESIFKCENPRTGEWLEFTDAKLVARDAGTLSFAMKGGETVQVRYALAHQHAFTALVR
ncbi:MAG: 4'-phosphopantetheinyl transferase superfamily protein [Archangiaceae bacterium]|nr:4'-phosphopantetheinyl transferase superfamily protein [Archangiaceae bacterium]